MNYISDILTKDYSDQGIQDVSVYYDTLVFNTKVKNDSEYYNIVLIEKFQLDYSTNSIQKINNGISINFGNTQNSQPFVTNGDCFVGSFLESKNKKIILIGLNNSKISCNIPVIYEYDINKCSLELLFPKQSDLDNFQTIENYTFSSDYFPTFSYQDGIIFLNFKTEDSDNYYMNNISIKLHNKTVDIKDYKLYQYPKSTDLVVKDFDNATMTISYSSYLGVLTKI